MIRFFKNMSLFTQVLAVFWLTILLISLTIIAIPELDPRNQKDLPPEAIEHFQKQADQISTIHRNKKVDSDRLNHLNARMMQMFHCKIIFTNQNGNLIFFPHSRRHEDRNSPGYRDQLREVKNFISLADDINSPQEKRYFKWKYMGPFASELNNEKVRIYFATMDKDPPFFFRFLDNPSELLLLIMIISTPVLIGLAWRLTIPARKLQQAANRVARGNLDVDKSLETGTKEFKETGESFNRMVFAINQMITGQQRLLSDISHELRSPLTRLRMATALATRKQGESNELTRIDLEANRLEKMINDLLSLSRMQINSHQKIEEITINTLWEDILKDAHFEAVQMDKTLIWNGLDEQLLEGNIKLLMSAFENVVRNAIKYADNKINIRFSNQDKILEILIDDDGIGVPEGERELIFKPFYRVSAARDRTTGGTGLGLAITESAIIQHLGKIEALESPLGGLRIKIQLPLKKSKGE